MRKLLLASLIAVSFAAQSQDKKKEIAKETTISDLKSNVKIETSSEAVFNLILTKYEAQIVRYVVSYKTDRQGRYKEYALYFAPEMKEQIVSSIKVNPL